MATLMTIRPDKPRTRTEQATFTVLATDAPVIDPVGMLPGELEILSDKVACDAMEEPTVWQAAALILHLHNVWGMKMPAVFAALAAATADGEHLILHI